MSNLIQLQKGSKAYGTRALFSDASFAVNEGEHVGVIGPNGAGKTTLFKVLIGEESLDTGQVVKSRTLSLGYLAQHDEWKEGQTVEEFLSEGVRLPIWDLRVLALGLGITEEFFSKVISSLSGGYRMRIKLLKLLGQEPTLMLLDEPTNYLDLETLMVLEKFLQKFKGAFLLISHDREFLRRTTDHILEVEQGEITKFNGNIDDYFEQKEMLRTQLEARAVSIEEKRKQVLDFVARFGAKATKASQAQSRLKSLDRLENIEVKPLPVRAKIKIPPPERAPKVILNLKAAELGYPNRTILKDASLQLMKGDHLAVVGLNGAGKSTLLKSLSGRLELKSGDIEFGYEVSTAFYAQHVSEELNLNDTVFEAMARKAHPSVLPQDILDLAGSLLFSGDNVKKTISVLSGGERSRVALGQCLLQRASCLFLDEPTNHLDFETVEALTQALERFEGAVVVVSHDRGFIRRVATKIFEVNSGRVMTYPGTYDDYVWSLEKGAFGVLGGENAAAEKSRKTETKTEPGTEAESFNYKDRKKELDRRLRTLERTLESSSSKVTQGQEALKKLNDELQICQDSKRRLEIVKEMGVIQMDTEESEEIWLTAAQEKEELEDKMRGLTQKFQ